MVKNTNEEWEEIFIDRNKDSNIDIFKLLKISNFGIYLITNETYLINYPGKEKKQLQSQMTELFALGDPWAKNMEYLVKPSKSFYYGFSEPNGATKAK